MRIGSVSVAHPIVLAPMEEHTNLPFRLLMKQHGASLVSGERVDACDVAKRDRRAMRLLTTATGERPVVGQISGRDPHEMSEAAKVFAVPISLSATASINPPTAARAGPILAFATGSK